MQVEWAVASVRRALAIHCSLRSSAAAHLRRWASETERQRERRMKQISGLMFGLLALLIVESPAAQTNYAEKPIRMVVGFPPGSSSDTVARLLAQKCAEAWGRRALFGNAAGPLGAI